jgi:hypothetical protein
LFVVARLLSVLANPSYVYRDTNSATDDEALYLRDYAALFGFNMEISRIFDEGSWKAKIEDEGLSG